MMPTATRKPAHPRKMSDYTPPTTPTEQETPLMADDVQDTTVPAPTGRTITLNKTITATTSRAILARVADGIVPTRVLNTSAGLNAAFESGITVYMKGDRGPNGEVLVLNEDDFPLQPIEEPTTKRVIGYHLKTGVDTVLGLVSQEAADEYRRTEGGALRRWNDELHGTAGSESLTLNTLRPNRSNLPSNVRQVQLNKPPA